MSSLDYNDLLSYFSAKKTLTGTQLYLTLTEEGDAEIAPQRARGTNLRISFGLGVVIEALRDTKATLNGQALKAGTVIEASIEDAIIAHGEVEISLLDLRRRAREFGAQFRLEGSRNTYLSLQQSRSAGGGRHPALRRNRGRGAAAHRVRLHREKW